MFKAFLFSRDFWCPVVCGCGCSSWFANISHLLFHVVRDKTPFGVCDDCF